MGNYRPIVLTILLMGLVVLLQTTVLELISIRKVTPDLQLILLMFIALRRGSMSGQITGFCGGLLEDLTSLSPLGFHAIVRTVVGFCAGLMHGWIRTSTIIIPVLVLLGAEILKGAVSSLLEIIYGIHLDLNLTDGKFWIEACYTAVIAPPLFVILGYIRMLKPAKKSENNREKSA